MADIKLGIVGEALVKKIDQTKKLLTPKQLEYLESQGYKPRGTGFVNVSTNKFVSNDEIQRVLQSMPSDDNAEPISISKNSVNGKTTVDADPVYGVVKSIAESISQFVDIIVTRPVGIDKGMKAEPSIAVPELKEIDGTKGIFDKLLKLGTSLALLSTTVLFPLFNMAKSALASIAEFSKTAFNIAKESIVSFFTVTVSDFFEDLKDFFIVDMPFKLKQMVDVMTDTIKSLMDITGKIVDSIKDYGLNLTKSVLDKFNPWLSALNINTKNISKDIDNKKRELELKEKESIVKRQREAARIEKLRTQRDIEFQREKKELDESKRKERAERDAQLAKEKQEREAQEQKEKYERVARERERAKPAIAAPIPRPYPEIYAQPVSPVKQEEPAKPVEAPKSKAAKPEAVPVTPSTKKSTLSGPLSKLLNVIASKESGGHYDVVYGGKRIPEIVNMTISEVLSLQKNARKDSRFGKGSSAAGKYQMLPSVIEEEAKKLGLNFNTELFSPENQDKMIANRLKRYRKFDKFINGAISIVEFGKNLAMEFASFPVLSKTKGSRGIVERGQSYYAGDSLNKSLISADSVESLLSEIKAGGQQVNSATKAANIKPPKPATVAKPIPGSSSVVPSGKEKGAVLSSAPNSTNITNNYKAYFAVS